MKHIGEVIDEAMARAIKRRSPQDAFWRGLARQRLFRLVGKRDIGNGPRETLEKK